MVAHQTTQFFLAFKPFLSCFCYLQQQLHIVLLDALVIGFAGFVGDGEGSDIVAEGFFKEEDAAQAAVVVVERVESLEGNMEAQELFQAVWGSLVGAQEICDGFAYLLWREAKRVFFGAESAGDAFAREGGYRTRGQDAVKSFDQRHRQWLHSNFEHGPDASEVVHDLQQVIDLHGFKGRADLARAKYLLDLVPGQAVAGHAT